MLSDLDEPSGSFIISLLKILFLIYWSTGKQIRRRKRK